MLPGAVSSAPPPSCIASCSNVSHSDPEMAPACHTEGTVCGGGFSPPRSPPCPRHAYAINALAWLSALPTGHYTPQLERALVPPLLGTSSKTFWACLPCLCLPCNPSNLTPLSLRRVGFGGRYLVTPLARSFLHSGYWTRSHCLSW